MTQPYRAPDEVLKLQEQLADARNELEDLRRERDTINEALRELRRRDHQTVRAKSNNRTIAIVTLAAFGLLAWLISNMRQCEVEKAVAPEGACRDTIVTVGGYGWDKCPYAN